MALSSSILDKIKEKTENKKNGIEETGSSGSSATTQGSSNSSSKSSLSSSIRDRISFAVALKKLGYTDGYEDYYDDITSVDDNYINQFLSDWNRYSNRIQTAYEGLNWKNAQAWGLDKSYESTAKDLMIRSAVIRSYADSRRNDLDEDSYNELISHLDSIQQVKGTFDSAFTDIKNYYAQWATEEDYNDYLSKQKAYEELVNFDLEAGQKELDALEAARKEYKSWKYLTGEDVQAKYRQFGAEYGDIKNLEAMISEKTAYLNTAKRAQEGVALAGVSENADFSQYSGYAAPEDGYDITYEFINHRSGYWQNLTNEERINPEDETWTDDAFLVKGYDLLTDDEIAIYNYYYARDGKEAAQKYLDSIQEKLNYRVSTDMFSNMEDNTLLELAFGVAAGLDQYGSSLESLGRMFTGNDSYVPTSAMQYASGMAREDLEDVGIKLPDWMGGASLGQGAYDAITTTANMAPSILISTAIGLINPTVGTWVGVGMMGGGAAGSAYQEKINLGYSKEQARSYSVMVGASEALLEKLLGGITKLGGGSLSDTVLKNLGKLDNVLAKVAQSTGGRLLANATSEAIEEGLQSVLEPYMWQAVSGEEATVDTAEALYSALLGFVTGGFFEGADIAAENITANAQYSGTGETIKGADGGVDALLKLANEVAGVASGSTQQDLTSRIGRVESKPTSKNVGKLYDTVQKANDQTNSAANQADVAKSLQRKGFSSGTANDIAAALVASYNGQELTSAQEKLLKSAKNSSVVQEAAAAIMGNPKSTMGQRSQNIRDFQKYILSGASRTNPASASDANVASSGKVDAQNESGAEDHYEASADGKTIDKDGNTVSIKGIASIEKGRMVLETEDGSTINAGDVTYGSQSEALVYEAVAKLEGIIDTDTANKLSRHLMKLGGASSDVYVNGIVQAYTYGYYGYGRAAMTGKDTLSGTLTEKQRNVAYGLGEQYRDAKTKADQATASKKSAVGDKNATTSKNSTAPDGTAYKRVRFEGEIKKWTEKQKAEVEYIDFIASNFSGNTVHVYESYKGEDGKYYYKDSNGKTHVAPNGFYIGSTGDIYLDLNAGTHGEGLILNTFAHELYHHIQKRSPAKARKLAEFLVKELGYKSVEEAVNRQIAKAERGGYGVDFFMKEKGMSRSAAERTVYDRAFSDFVADSLETMFTEGDAVSKLQKLKAQDNTLFNWIKGFIDKWVTKLREFYSNHSTISIEGSKVASLEKFEQIQQMFMEALVDAGGNYQKAEKSTTGDGGVDGECDIQLMAREEEAFKPFAKKINSVINQAIAGKGYIDGRILTEEIMPVGPKLSAMVAASSDNAVDISNKSIALNSGDTWHEYKRHTGQKAEESRDQVAFTKRQFQNAVKCIISPDIVETIFASKSNPTQKQSFAYAKKTNRGHYVVVEAVGGNKNPHIYPVMILQFSKAKWNKMMSQGKTLGEILFENDTKKLNALDIEQNKKSRVTAAQFASYEAIATTLRSPQLKTKVTQTTPEVKNESVETLMDAGIAVDSETDAGAIFSVRDVLDDTDRKKVSKALAERFDVTEKEAEKWLTAETSLASLILNPKYSAYLDYEADPGETAIKQNSDYPQGTVDFSNICKKRREFTQVMNRVLRNFPNHVFAATDLAKIRTIMGEEGMTLPCGICYVEDRRQLDTIVAQDFINSLKLYREGSKTRPDGKPFNANQLKGLQLTDGDTYVPTIYELVSLEGRNSLKAKNPNMEAAWVRYNNARGMQSVRLLTNEAEYKRQILKYNKKTVQSKNDHGGLRIYSFSDAEMFHLIDIIQVITDSAAVGLTLQGYTKVNEYAKAVKDTGEKLNRSLIPLGELGYHIENGKVVLDYDTVEGIDIYSKDFFDNKDNPDVGNITIGVNDTQIRAAMVSDFVDQIIPFHTGQSEEVLGEKGIAAWKNYKDFQTEKDLTTGRTSSHQVNIYTEVFQAAESEGKPIRNKRQFVEKFLQVCKDNGLQPRFSQFLNTDAQGNYIYTEGYHKFLVDFKTFAQTEIGEYLPQKPVKPIFDNAYITGLLKDYVKEQQVKDAEVAKQMPKVIERITNEIIKPSQNDQNVLYSDRISELTEDEVYRLIENSNHGEYALDTFIPVRRDTPPLMVELSKKDGLPPVKNLPIIMNVEHIQQCMDEEVAANDGKRGHALSTENIIDIIKGLDDPRYVFFQKDNKRYCEIVEYDTDKKGEKAMAIVTYTGNKNQDLMNGFPGREYNILVTAYPPDAKYWRDYQKSSNNMLIYDKTKDAPQGSYGSHVPSLLSGSPFATNKVTQPDSKVKKFSDRDTDGYQLSEEQQEFFKDSVVRDENGNLKRMYHGTANGGHTVFDIYGKSKYGLFGQGAYFTDDPEVGLSYTQKGKTKPGKTPELYEVYLNIKKPMDMDAVANPAEWDEVFPDASFPKSGTNEDFYRAMEEYFEDEMLPKWEASEIAMESIQSMGYDGITHVGGGMFNKADTNRHRVYIAFASEQIKSFDNKNPTSNPDIHYQSRDDNSVSNRSLLANALEGVAQNDIERNRLQEYKGKISLIEAEERKLSDLNAQIKELSFAKGKRDTAKILALRDEATKTANRIGIYDSQLLRLEASKPLQDVLEREKKKAYQRAERKGKAALEEYRKKAIQNQREIIERYQESRKRGIDSRNRTAMRHKIQNVVNELNNLLLNGDKKRHVPESLKKAVADALALVNMDTVGAEERVAKYADLIAKETDPDKIDAYTVTMENILRQGEKMGQRLKELRDAYEEISESDDPDIANAYDPVIAGCLNELAQSIGNTSLKDMTIEQLSDVYDMYRMVLTRVRDANKSFVNEKKEAISNLASRVVGEVRRTGGEHKYRAAVLDSIKKFGWNNLKPVYAFEHIGSATLTEAFNGVRAGEDVWAKDVMEAREYYLDKAKKFGYNSWDFKKKYRFKSDSDLDFDLTLEQILSLYAYSKREQAHDHLRLGGFVFDSNIETYTEKGSKILKYKVNTADAHQITQEILADIISKLSKEQMAFVDEMQEYLSTVMGAKGNEITMKMYGVKLFKEKFYFPLKSAKQFMFEQNEVSGEVKIKNSGFTNKTVAKANNPVILNNFMDVWAGHVNDMSMYHAFVLPLEDFNRIFNYNSPKKEGQPSVSVKGTIQSAYTPAAVNYVKQLITDLNGGARTDSTTGFINKMMGMYKKGAVFANLSVVVQQPSAIARAAALVDTKYFIGPKVDQKRHKALWNEVKQYAPVAIIKEMGYFDTNMGKSTQDFILGEEYSGFTEKMKALVTDSGYRDEILSKAPALADEIAWCGIWEAVKRETKAKNAGMDVKSEAFLKKAGERFTEVIVKTQVYDSVLSRSANMRSKDTGMKMVTAFMAEPTTSINMVADALLQGKRGNRKYCRAAIGAVIASQILNSILVSFVYAGRDDDEDKTYWEKYIGTLTGEILDSLNPAGYIPFIKDIMSIVQGYDVERSDMSVISDLWSAWQKLSNDNVSVYRKVEDFAGSIAQIFGLPVKNIMRDARSIYQTVMSFMNGRQTTKAGIGYAVKASLPAWLGGGETSNQQQLYEAILSGDKTQIARVEGRFEDQSAINSAIRKALRENDSRIRAAAEAKVGGDLDEYMRLTKEIIGEGHFSQDNVVAAINAEINALSKEENTSSTTQKASGMFNADDFALAIAQGDSAMANAIKTDIIQTAQKNGKTAEEAEKSFISSAASACKELFLEGELSERQTINALQTYCGKTEDEAMADVQYWAFKQDYPDVYADDAWFDKYYEDVADSGISINVYMEYRNQVKDITGEGKKERRMAIINSMPITSAQKDALYFAEGWAESKLHEAPWH